MEQIVLGDCLGQLFRFLKDGGPALDRVQVVTHLFAGLKHNRNVESRKSEVDYSLHVPVSASNVHITESGSYELVDSSAVSVAEFDFSKVIIFSKTINQACCEVGDFHQREAESVFSEHL